MTTRAAEKMYSTPLYRLGQQLHEQDGCEGVLCDIHLDQARVMLEHLGPIIADWIEETHTHSQYWPVDLVARDLRLHIDAAMGRL